LSAPEHRAAATSISLDARAAAANIHIGIDWLSSGPFGHMTASANA
jgi:hypothetical protein